jgi:hypothetical protein
MKILYLLPPKLGTGEGPQTSECISSPSVPESGALHSFWISLQVSLACLHASHVTVAPLLISCTPSMIPLLTIFWMESGAMCARHLCMVTMSTHSSGIEATYTRSALYRPCLLAWIALMGVPVTAKIARAQREYSDLLLPSRLL